MTIVNYPKEESIERIYRIFRGDTLNQAVGSLTGAQYSSDEALSRLVQLLEGQIPGETAALPSTISPTIASQAEAEVGTNNVNFMTPLRVSQASDQFLLEQWSVYEDVATSVALDVGDLFTTFVFLGDNEEKVITLPLTTTIESGWRCRAVFNITLTGNSITINDHASDSLTIYAPGVAGVGTVASGNPAIGAWMEIVFDGTDFRVLSHITWS
jgi:hypothetical protein